MKNYHVVGFFIVVAILAFGMEKSAEPDGTQKGRVYRQQDYTPIVGDLGILWDRRDRICLFRVNPKEEEWNDCHSLSGEYEHFYLHSTEEDLGLYSVEIYVDPTKWNSAPWTARPLK